MLGRFWILLGLLLAGPVCGEVIYKWVDELGVTQFSGTPPEQGPAEQLHFEFAPLDPESSGLRPGEQRMLEEIQKAEAEERRAADAETERQEKTAQQVFGSIVLNFRGTEDAILPPPALDFQLVVHPEASDVPVIAQISEQDVAWQRSGVGAVGRAVGDERAVATLNFRIELTPGDYRIASLEVHSKEMEKRHFSLPISAHLRVPLDTQCVYAGRLLLFYMRLAPGPRHRQRAAATTLQRQYGRSEPFIYLPDGGLVLVLKTLDVPSANENKSSISSSTAHFRQALELGCRTEPSAF
jgi:hypothetical protein